MHKVRNKKHAVRNGDTGMSCYCEQCEQKKANKLDIAIVELYEVIDDTVIETGETRHAVC